MAHEGTNLIVILGRKKSGKSTLARVLVSRALRSGHHRFIVWDPTYEWLSRKNVEVFQPHNSTAFDAAWRALEVGDVTLVVDEMDFVTPVTGQGFEPPNAKTGDPGSPFHRIVNCGRHDRVALIALARRTARLNHDIPGLADVVFLFRHTEPGDVDYISRACGGSGVASAVTRLQPREWLRVNL